MKYQDIIDTVNAIINSENIHMNGLSLAYELTEKNHTDLNEEIFHMFNPMSKKFVPDEEFEVLIGGIVVKFTKIVVE